MEEPRADGRQRPKEEKFFAALRDVFVGAVVEGDSGFINLMKVKSRYFQEGVFPRLEKDIDEALTPFPDFREELFDKLYTFFHRYFNECGSVYFRYTPLHQNVYEKVYTDDRDVMLFWKTHMLYYVKTDRLFHNLQVEVDEAKFSFDVSALEHKRANEKRQTTYSLKDTRGDSHIKFSVAYQEGGKQTDIDGIARTLKTAGAEVSMDTIERAFAVFERQNEVDYFINKDAKAFLEEQFNLWMYQYVFSGETEWTEKRITQLQVLKDIAYKTIAFVAQFEDELVKIWNKPKFVRNSNYVITLDKIAHRDMDLLDRMLGSPGFEAQVQEWRELGIVVGELSAEAVFADTPVDKRHPKDQYRYLPLDTKHFKAFELEILGLFDHLDQEIDGRIVNSENYQALRTIQRKYKPVAKCIYIDPPYNKENSSDDFAYLDNYQRSSWLSMIHDRLDLMAQLLREDGVLFSSIDHHELMDLVAAAESLPDYQVVRVVPAITNLKGNYDTAGFVSTHEYVVVATKQPLSVLNQLEIDEERIREEWETDDDGLYKEGDSLRATGVNAPREKRRNLYYPIFVLADGSDFYVTDDDKPRDPGDSTLWPINDKGEELSWYWEKGKVAREKHNLILKKKKSGYALSKKQRASIGDIPTRKPKSFLYAPEYSSTSGGNVVQEMFGYRMSQFTPKSPALIRDLLLLGSKTGDLVLDFYAGSGTTAHAAVNMDRMGLGKRRYLLTEMAHYANDIVLPRVKKAIFCERWGDGKAAGGKGVSHFLKYYELEQYEDALRKVRYDDAELFDNPYEDPYHQYVFLPDEKMLAAVDVDRDEAKVKVDLSRLYDDIDIPETLSNLTGKWIRRVGPDFVEFEDGERIDTTNLDYRLIQPLIWWR